MLCQEKETYDAVVFQGFLSYVLSHYPSGKMVMILDNASIHHAKLIQPFHEENRACLELSFLSKCSKIILAVRAFFNRLTDNGNNSLTGFVSDYKVIL